MVSRCGLFAWPRFESRVRQGGKLRLLDAPGAADYFLDASVRCAPPPGSNSAHPCARTRTARVAADCPAAIAAHRRISRRSATPRRARFTRASRAPLVTHAQASVPSRCRLAERVGARRLACCERVPVAPQEAPRRRRASLGRPGGGHRSRRGQPRRRDASVAPLWMRSCAQQRKRALSKKSGVTDVTKYGNGHVLSSNRVAS